MTVRFTYGSAISDLLPAQSTSDGERQGFFDYQWDAIDTLLAHPRHVLADQPGLGKTFEILGALEVRGDLTEPGRITLILAPKIVAQIGWKPAIERFVRPAYPGLHVVYAFDGSAAKKEADVADALRWTHDEPVLIVANHNAIDWPRRQGKPPRIPSLLAPYYSAIVVDEAHLVLPTSENATSANLTQFWHGLTALREHQRQARWAVTGTPDRGKLENRLGTWRFLWPSDPQFSLFWPWVTRNFRTYKRVVNRRGTTVTEIEQKPLDVLGWLNFDRAHILRRTKQEVLPQLPPKQYINVDLDMTPRMKAAYKAYEDELFRIADQRLDAGLEESARYLKMKMYTRGRQLAICEWEYETTHASEHGTPLPAKEGDSPKLDWLVEFLAERAGTGAKVVVASDFTQILEWLHTHLWERIPGIQMRMLTGDTSDGHRAAIQEAFQTGDLDVVLLSQRLGTGITLDAADDLVLVDVPSDPDKVEQVEDRVHRAGSFHQVTIWRLISLATKDVAIVKQQDATYAKLRRLSDSSRGVDNSRKITKQKGQAAS